MELTIPTSRKRQVIDVTETVEQQLPQQNGIAIVFVTHTTAAITTADLDPGTDQDFLDFLAAITPDLNWRHPHNPDHAPDHLLASIIGSSLTLPFHHGRLQLGTWQRIVLVEFDGPRQRQILVQVTPTS